MKILYKQRGAVLVISLVILLLVTLIGVSSVGTGTLQLKMSSNEETRMESFQMAQAALDEVTSPAQEGNMIVCGAAGSMITQTSDYSYDTCGTDLTLQYAPQGKSKILVKRLAPEEGSPPRMPGSEFSTDKFRAAFLQIEAEGTSSNSQGRTELSQGYLIIIPSVSH